MNKKGFTLVELLAVLVIITLLAVLAFSSIIKKSNELKSISNTKYEELLKTSAKMYVNANEDIKLQLKSGSSKTITYKELQDSGYMAEGLKDLNNSNIDTTKVCIVVSYNNYSYTYTLNENCN